MVSFSSYPIRRVVFSGAVDLLAPVAARKTLASAKSAGWRIVQSEWHHDMFHPARDGTPPQSLFSFEVHSEHTDSITRCIL
ncbi:MAG: hypothetical protein VB980_06545 [Opitutales bacterium]